MKKKFLFILSLTVAMGITFYIKDRQAQLAQSNNKEWKTFIKKPGKEVASYPTTKKEFEEARITTPSAKSLRAPASIHSNPLKGFMVRNKRVLMGDVDPKYEDENADLKMVNHINPNWKEVMGNDLMRFQPAETKLIVKEENPVIDIREDKGRFLEQVQITYLTVDGDRSSFKALVDSETGMVLETWDRTIQEQLGKKREGLTLPTGDNGIISR